MHKSGNKPSGISTCSYMYIALELYMLYVYPTFKRNFKKLALGPSKKKMGEFIEPGTHRCIISKSIEKIRKCILLIALNPKILHMRFLTAQLNRTLSD